MSQGRGWGVVVMVLALTGCTGMNAFYPYDRQIAGMDLEAVARQGAPDIVAMSVEVRLDEEVTLDVLLESRDGKPRADRVCGALQAFRDTVPFTPDRVTAGIQEWGQGPWLQAEGLGQLTGTGDEYGFMGTWSDFVVAVDSCVAATAPV